MIIGGFVFFPLAQKFGRSSAIFWSLLGLMAAQIWSACMTHKGDYASFLGSRVLSGFFGTVTGILGPRILVDLFFLHQRGRAFTAFHFFFDFGTVAGPTLGAFVAANRSWTAAYWYTFALAGVSFIMCFFFLYETAWNREPEADHSYTSPESFVASRLDTFFPGTKVAPHTSFADFVRLSLISEPYILTTFVAQSSTQSVHSCHNAGHNLPRLLYACQFWFLCGHECHHTGLASEAGEDWRLWLYVSTKCSL